MSKKPAKRAKSLGKKQMKRTKGGLGGSVPVSSLSLPSTSSSSVLSPLFPPMGSATGMVKHQPLTLDGLGTPGPTTSAPAP